ncbi:hypothetical protein GGS20DRAFT_549619 [Poronia punctata]|nr:hypothetical protein GGS20DRAFT_549619 [Poronia punctata]
MEDSRYRKFFYWGCSIPIDPRTGFPSSTEITHVRNCECPEGGEEDDGVCWVILERAHHLHQSNVVKYMIPWVNDLTQRIALKLGVDLWHGIDELPFYEDKIRWDGDVCIEVIGRAFTDQELDALYRLPWDQAARCEWVI